MIVVIDGRRYDIAEGIGDRVLPADPVEAKRVIHRYVFRRDAGWFDLAGGGEVLMNWGSAKTIDVGDPDE